VDGKQISKIIESITDVLRRAFLVGAKPDVSASKKVKQADCPHQQGCAGPGPWSAGTSIVWHTFEDDPEHPKGICTNCQRLWVYTDPDYREWFAKRSGNKPSTGGIPQKSSARPYIAGTPLADLKKYDPKYDPNVIRLGQYPTDNATYTDDSAFMYGDTEKPKHPVDEPPITEPLHTYLLKELLKGAR
jgi:hypothetical protein